MRTGWIISAGLHAAALIWALFAAMPGGERARDVSRVTTVSLVPAPEAERPAPAAPQQAEEVAPAVPEMSVAAPDAPATPAEAGPPAPAADSAPGRTAQEDIAAPSAPDRAADLTALRRPVEQPDAVQETAAPEAAPATEDAPALAMPQPEGADRLNQTPRGPERPTPPAPRAAPRIATASPPPPERPAPEAETPAESAAATTAETPAEERPAEAAASIPETAPALPSEAESGAEDGRALARAAPPRARPRDFAEQLAAGAEEADAVLAAVQQAQQDAANAPPAPAEQTAPAEQAAQPATAPERAEVPAGPPLTPGELEGLRVAIGDYWVVPPALESARDLRVVLAVELDPDGRIVSQPRLIAPARADRPEVRAAFEAARRALLRASRAGAIELPPEKYPQWRSMEVAFDPRGMLIGW